MRRMGRKAKLTTMSIGYIYVVTLQIDSHFNGPDEIHVVGTFLYYNQAAQAIKSEGWRAANNFVDEPLWYCNDKPDMRDKWLYVEKVPIDFIDWDTINSA